jgi:hypothetical protein
MDFTPWGAMLAPWFRPAEINASVDDDWQWRALVVP